MSIGRLMVTNFLLSCVILVQSSDFFLAKQYDEERYLCVTNSSFALSWIDEEISETLYQVSQYVPEKTANIFDSDIKDDYRTSKHFARSSWTLKTNYELVLDERWEELPITRTEYVFNVGNTLEYNNILNVDASTDFNIPLSIRTEQEGHIFLCDGTYPPNSNCYWFMLQAFNNTKTAIRKCNSGLITSKHGEWPQGDCRIQQVLIEHPKFPRYLSNKKWSHFMLSKQSNVLTFSQVEENDKRTKIIEWSDNENPIDVTNLIVHSKRVNGLWKIHKLDYIFTTSEIKEVYLGPEIYAQENLFCVSMYISMCSSCKISLSLAARKKIINEKTYSYQHSGWTNIRFLTEGISNPTALTLLVSTSGTSQDRFWAIDKIQLCQKEEFRLIRLTAKVPCQLMSSSSEVIIFLESSKTQSVTDNKCPGDTIGEFCVKSKWLFDRPDKIKICTEDKCVCSAGYYGKYCYTECRWGYYGHGCEKRCGKCIGCNKINGICFGSACEDYYSGPKCDIPPSLIFTYPPEIITLSNTYAVIRVANFTTENPLPSVQQPGYYAIQYKVKADSSRWILHNQINNFNTISSIKIDQLESKTMYNVRSVIITSQQSWQVGDHLKFSNFTTTCEEISDDNIYVAPTNTSAFISIINTTNSTCKYVTRIFGLKDTGYTISSGTYFDSLNPFTEYTAIVQGTYYTYRQKFKTSEREKSKTSYDLKINWTIENDLKLEWKHPNETNGDVRHFVIDITNKDKSSKIQKLVPVSPSTYSLTYNCTIKFEEIQPTTFYIIRLYANNGLDGLATSQSFESPPDLPRLAGVDFNSSTDTIAIKITPSKIRGRTDKYRLLLLRSQEENDLASHTELQKFDLKGLKLIFDCDITTLTDHLNVTLGNNHQLNKCTETENFPLKPETSYNVTIILINNYKGKSRDKVYSYISSTTGGHTSSTLLILTILLALLLLLLLASLAVILYMKMDTIACIKKKTPRQTNPDSRNLEQSDNIELIEAENRSLYKIDKKSKTYSNKIPAKNYANYVETSLRNKDLKLQHEIIFETMSSYQPAPDRVCLEEIDMIYTSGIQVSNAYMVSNMPDSEERNAFWALIWDENIRYIILFEHIHTNKDKFKQYWPKSNDKLRFGNITVQGSTCRVYATYYHRKFIMKCENKTREIEQFHLSLRCHDRVILSSLNYTSFFQTMSEIPHSSGSPILVHSSSGMRGTGFALLCDMSLRTAREDGMIDMMANLHRLARFNREMMTDFDHYAAAHVILADILLYVDTGIKCESFNADESILVKSVEIQKQLKYANDTLWLDKIHTRDDPEHDIYYIGIPFGPEGGQLFVPHVIPEDTPSHERFNIFKVDGFRSPEKFLVAQRQPSNKTLNDFMILIKETKTLVVLLFDENISWPNEDYPSIELKNRITLRHKTTKYFSFHDSWISLELTIENVSQTVEIFSLKSGVTETDSLPIVSNFVNFCIETNEMVQKTDSVIIASRDGTTISGLYLTMNFIMQKIKIEGVCDACACVRSIRRYSEQFLKDEKQFKFLLEATHHYMKEFSLYELR